MERVRLNADEDRNGFDFDVEVEFGKRSLKVASNRWDPCEVEMIWWHDVELRSSKHTCASRKVEDVGVDEFGVDPSPTESRRQRLLHFSSVQ